VKTGFDGKPDPALAVSLNQHAVITGLRQCGTQAADHFVDISETERLTGETR